MDRLPTTSWLRFDSTFIEGGTLHFVLSDVAERYTRLSYHGVERVTVTPQRNQMISLSSSRGLIPFWKPRACPKSGLWLGGSEAPQHQVKVYRRLTNRTARHSRGDRNNRSAGEQQNYTKWDKWTGTYSRVKERGDTRIALGLIMRKHEMNSQLL